MAHPEKGLNSCLWSEWNSASLVSYWHGYGQGWLKEFLIKFIFSTLLHECYPCSFIYFQRLLLKNLKIPSLGICPRTVCCLDVAITVTPYGRKPGYFQTDSSFRIKSALVAGLALQPLEPLYLGTAFQGYYFICRGIFK